VNISIYFDGGCRPTNPGHIYGSYEVLIDGRPVAKVTRLEMGWGTNNDAEFMILERALAWTAEALAGAGNTPGQFTLAVFSDATIIVNRLNGRNKTAKTQPQQRMQRHAVACLKWMTQFKSYRAMWNGRAVNVAKFGH